MELSQHPVPDVGDGPQFSNLESTLVSAKVEARPISKDGQHLFRHRDQIDRAVNELDYEFDSEPDQWPLLDVESAHDLWSNVVYQDHFKPNNNFSDTTLAECLKIDANDAQWLRLEESDLTALLEETSKRQSKAETVRVTAKVNIAAQTGRTLLFFMPLKPESNATSYQYQLPLTPTSAKQLFSTLDLNPSFLPNMLGRPDYWAPQSRWDQTEDRILGFDLFSQFPRWNLQTQGAPMSVYCKCNAEKDFTVYIISHNQNDTVANSLRKLLQPLINHEAKTRIHHILQESPLDILAVICTLNFEASKWHVKRFQRFQWRATNGVDDFLAGKDQGDRTKLASMLKDLQVVAQNADSHLANAQVFLYTARAVAEVTAKLNTYRTSRVRVRTLDMMRYLIQSMEKQHMWFSNYKGRKENLMNLVFHFNTQTDALNNIELAADMKKDSTSMNAIAGLTMVFLPGTFTASVLSAGIFSSEPGQNTFKVTGLWWLWTVTTIPITLVTVLSWWMYKKSKVNTMRPTQLSFKNTEEKEELEFIETRRKSSVTARLRTVFKDTKERKSGLV